MADDNFITPNGVERIRREMEWLRLEERPRIVAEVAWAASLGDRSENAEYIYGKKRLREIDSRLGFLLKCLHRVQVVNPVDVGGDRVRFGATVVLWDEEGRERTYRIYGQHEVDVDAGILSHKSPIARALMGKAAGEEVSFSSPGGMRGVEILEVRYDVQDPLPEPEWMVERSGGKSGKSKSSKSKSAAVRAALAAAEAFEPVSEGLGVEGLGGEGVDGDGGA
jgi:transcription elongation factor GreB